MSNENKFLLSYTFNATLCAFTFFSLKFLIQFYWSQLELQWENHQALKEAEVL